MTVFLWENNIKIVRGMDKPNDALLNLKKINKYIFKFSEKRDSRVQQTWCNHKKI